MSYSQYLKHPLWQKKRLEIFQRDNFMCQWCHETEMTLHVHHFIYESGKLPWEYNNLVLITLCDDCHSVAHLTIDPLLFKVLIGLRGRGNFDAVKLTNQYILEAYGKRSGIPVLSR